MRRGIAQEEEDVERERGLKENKHPAKHVIGCLWSMKDTDTNRHKQTHPHTDTGTDTHTHTHRHRHRHMCAHKRTFTFLPRFVRKPWWTT